MAGREFAESNQHNCVEMVRWFRDDLSFSWWSEGMTVLLNSMLIGGSDNGIQNNPYVGI